jgi:parvulin-like peptidyl-prolyl isomerase
MKRVVICMFLLLPGLAQSFSTQSSPDRAVASTKTWTITAQQFEQFLQLLPDQTFQYFSSHRREFLDQLIRMWVMADQARMQELDKTPKFKATVEFYANNLLAGELHRLQVTGSVTASDEAVRQFYESHKTDFTQIQLSHILIFAEDKPAVREAGIPGALPAGEARRRIEEVQGKIRSGEEFAELARQYSQDDQTAENGGDLGYTSRGRMDPNVEDVVFALQEGSYSDVVETAYGFELFHVTGLRVGSLDEVSAQIRQKLDMDQFNAEVDTKIRDAGIQVDESFFEN